MTFVDAIGKIVLGAVCIATGLKFIWNPIYYNRQPQRVIDLSGFNLPSGAGLIIFGIILVYLVMTQKKER